MRAVESPVSVLMSVLRRENPGEPHAVLTGGEVYVSPRFDREAGEDWRAELARAGLTERQLRDVAVVIQRADVEYYGWVEAPGEDYALLVAARGRDAISLVRRGDMVTLDNADPDRLAHELVSLLPGVPAARPHDVRRLEDLMRLPRLSWAQLYAAARDRSGVRHRSADAPTCWTWPRAAG